MKTNNVSYPPDLYKEILECYDYEISYSPDLYKEILECYDYEIRNTTIYGKIVTF